MATVAEPLRDRLLMQAFLLVRKPLFTGLRMLDDPAGVVFGTPGQLEDPYPAYARIRRRGTVVRSRFPAMAFAAGHAAVLQMLREHTVSPPYEAFAWDSPLDPSMLSMDPPDHTRIRKLVAQAFTPRAIGRMRDRADEITADLLDGLDRKAASGQPIDLMHDYASPLPIRMICEMLGLPADDLDAFREWGSAVALSLEAPQPGHAERIQAAGAELEAVFTAAFEERRERPRDDVLTGLVQARDGGDRLSDRELVATSILILLAGFETTVNLIGNGVMALLEHPPQRAIFMADPHGLSANTVEEVLRYDPPVQLTSRFTPDGGAEVDGVALGGRTNVVCLLGGANRDPDVFDDPDLFDITRENARDHLSFSSGVHHCLGASLARLEGQVALAGLLDRFPGLHQAGPTVRRDAQVLRGYESFPIALHH